MIILRSIRWPRKDIKRRKIFIFFEMRKLILKSLLNNYIYNFRWKLYFSNLFYNFPSDSSTSKYQTFCTFLLQGRSIFKFFKLCRHMVKLFASNALLNGFQKSSF